MIFIAIVRRFRRPPPCPGWGELPVADWGTPPPETPEEPPCWWRVYRGNLLDMLRHGDTRGMQFIDGFASHAAAAEVKARGNAALDAAGERVERYVICRAPRAAGTTRRDMP